MAIPGGTLTGTSAISNLVQTAYDQYVRMALRSIPVMRALADVKPVQQAMPGSSVVFSIYSDLAQATSTLTETSDVSSIALGNPTQVPVTLQEYGSAVTTTKKLNLTSFNDVDAALADIIAYNAADSIDAVVASVLTAGSNVLYAGTATSTNTVAATDKMTVSLIRKAVTELRTNKALPRIGELYAAYLHPRQTADLRAETGTGGFQELSKYVDRTPFVAGAVGVIEGAFVVETPRVPYAANSASVNVYKAVVAGREALAEAMGQDISTVIGPQIDALRRFHTIGWYYFGGWSLLRQAAIYRLETAATNGQLAVYQAGRNSCLVVGSLRRQMTYRATTPWQWQTWGAGQPWPDKYSRIAGKPITGGTLTGPINPFLTDIPRGVTLIVNGTTVTETLYPYQNTLADADWYILGGHNQEITDAQAQILIDAGYGAYVEPI